MAIKWGDAGTTDHFGLAFQYQIKKIIKKNGQKQSQIKNTKKKKQEEEEEKKEEGKYGHCNTKRRNSGNLQE